MKKLLFTLGVCALCTVAAPPPCRANWVDALQQVTNTLEDYNRQNEAKRQELENLYQRGVEALNNKNYDVAVECWSAAAQQGHAASQYSLGLCFLHGLEVKADAQQAFKLFNSAAKSGLPEAQAEVGRCCLEGIGAKQSYSDAFKWLSKAAKQEYVGAYANLGLCYYKGYGTKVNCESAAKYLLKAAEQNDVQAQTLLGQVYLDDSNPQRSRREGLKWLDKAASAGSYEAKMLLAVNCLRDSTDQNSIKKGVILFNEAIDASKEGSEEREKARICLSLCCLKGYGLAQKLDTGVELLSVSALKGNAYVLDLLQSLADAGVVDAKELLANSPKTAEFQPSEEEIALYDSVMAICAQTPDSSLTPGEFIRVCFQGSESDPAVLGQESKSNSDLGKLVTAAEMGNADAQTELGLLYASDKENNPMRNSEHRWKEACKWFNRAAQQGNTAAQTQLGLCYLNGRGVAQDQEKGIALLRGSAAEGDALAQHHLGQCYAQGLGVKQDAQQAHKLLSQAAAKGNSDSKEAIKNMVKEQGVLFVPASIYTNTKKFDGLKPYDAFTRGRQACQNGDPQGYALLDSSARRGCGHAKLCLAYGFLPQGHRLANGFPSFSLENKKWSDAERMQRFIKWMGSAADNGSLEANKTLGKVYQGGFGVNPNPGKAFQHSKTAAQQKDPAAMFDLGVCYAKGLGCQKDRASAVKWIKHSAHAGNAEAKRWIEDRRGHKVEFKNKYVFGEGDVKFGDTMKEIKMYYDEHVAAYNLWNSINDLKLQRDPNAVDVGLGDYNYTIRTKPLGNNKTKVTVAIRFGTDEYYLDHGRLVRVVRTKASGSLVARANYENLMSDIRKVHGNPIIDKKDHWHNSRLVDANAYSEWNNDGIHISLKINSMNLEKHRIRAESKIDTYQGPKIGGWEDLLK